MVKRPTKPGQLCRIIGGRMQVNGEGTGPNIGKLVYTLFLHQQQADDRVPVWRCLGEGLQTYYGVGSECDFLSVWLELVEEIPAPPLGTEQSKELTT